MTHEQMDQLVNDHFGFEAADDVNGVMGTLSEHPEHEVIPSPVGALTNRDEMRAYYQKLFDCLKGEKVEPLRRLYGDNFLVDETLWHGHITDGSPFLCDGKSGKVSFRILHIFEIDGDKITREQAWCDLASIQRQLESAVS